MLSVCVVQMIRAANACTSGAPRRCWNNGNCDAGISVSTVSVPARSQLRNAWPPPGRRLSTDLPLVTAEGTTAVRISRPASAGRARWDMGAASMECRLPPEHFANRRHHPGRRNCLCREVPASVCIGSTAFQEVAPTPPRMQAQTARPPRYRTSCRPPLSPPRGRHSPDLRLEGPLRGRHLASPGSESEERGGPLRVADGPHIQACPAGQLLLGESQPKAGGSDLAWEAIPFRDEP